MNVSKRSLKGLDLGDSAKVLEKKMTFFFAQPRSPAGGVPWGGKNMSICRKNKKGLVFIPSGPSAPRVKKTSPLLFYRKYSCFFHPRGPPRRGNWVTNFFLGIQQIFASRLDKFGQI